MGRITHITPVFQSGGGMQGIIRRQRALDQAAGHDSRVVALFDPPAAGGADLALGATGGWTPGRLRRRFLADAGAATRDALVIYHNAWGLPLLAPGDGAARRVAFLHSDWPGLPDAVRAAARWCDGILAVSGSLVESVQRLAPEFPAERVTRIQYPVAPPAGLADPGPGHPFRVGYVGRLEIAQKRVDRLPALLRAWPAAAGPVEWHVIGDGPARADLERSAGSARFHGWLEGEAYWRALASLDAVVSLSEFEGTPIALLEAMSVGVTPLFPAIGGDGEVLARSLDAACVYAPGDLAAAARQLAGLAGGDRPGRRQRARALVADLTPERYAAGVARALRDTWDWPRRSAMADNREGRWSDWLPMAVVRRYHERAIWR